MIGSDALRFFDADTRAAPANSLRRGAEDRDVAVRAVECVITRLDGERRTLEFSIALRRSESGKPTGYCGIVRDVTERARAADSLNQRFSELALLQQVDVELNQTLALDSVLAVALNAALLLSGAEAGFIGLIEHEKLRLARSVGGFPETWMSLDTGIIARAMRTQRAECVLDVMSDPDYHADLSTTRAEIAVPLIARNKVVGVLNLETAMPVLFTPDVFEFAQIVCARISAAVENARLYETLQAAACRTARPLHPGQRPGTVENAHDSRGSTRPARPAGDCRQLHRTAERRPCSPITTTWTRCTSMPFARPVTRMTQMTTDILSLERLDEHREVTLMRVSLGGLLERSVEEFAEQSRRCELDVHLNVEAAGGLRRFGGTARGDCQPDRQRHQVHADRAARLKPDFSATVSSPCWRLSTAASASPKISSRSCSSRSAASRRAKPMRLREQGWGCIWSSGLSSGTVARFTFTANMAKAVPLAFACRLPNPANSLNKPYG